MHINRKIYLIKVVHFICCRKFFFLSTIILIHSAIISMQSMKVFSLSFFVVITGEKPPTKNIVDYIGKHDVNWKVPCEKKKRERREKYRKETRILSFAEDTRENMRSQIRRVVFAKSTGRRPYRGASLFPPLCIQIFSLFLICNPPFY